MTFRATWNLVSRSWSLVFGIWLNSLLSPLKWESCLACTPKDFSDRCDLWVSQSPPTTTAPHHHWWVGLRLWCGDITSTSWLFCFPSFWWYRKADKSWPGPAMPLVRSSPYNPAFPGLSFIHCALGIFQNEYFFFHFLPGTMWDFPRIFLQCETYVILRDILHRKIRLPGVWALRDSYLCLNFVSNNFQEHLGDSSSYWFLWLCQRDLEATLPKHRLSLSCRYPVGGEERK